LGFIDSMLSGYGQICFNDNTLSGLLFLGACMVASPQQGVSGLVAVLVSTAASYGLGVPRAQLRLGLYSYNAALAGMGLALFAFDGRGITVGGIFYAALLGLLCVPLTAASFRILSIWKIPPLALPYCLSLAILVPAAPRFAALGAAVSAGSPGAAAPASGGASAALLEYANAAANGFAEIVWQHNAVSGLMVLAGIFIASRIDGLSAVCGVCAATLFGRLLGLPQGDFGAGVLGYNAALLMIVLFGRGYAASRPCFFFALCMALLTAPMLSFLSVAFMPFGIPVGAFPYTICAFMALAAKDGLKKLHWINPAEWGVPETIRTNTV
jgi:urea transporter